MKAYIAIFLMLFLSKPAVTVDTVILDGKKYQYQRVPTHVNGQPNGLLTIHRIGDSELLFQEFTRFLPSSDQAVVVVSLGEKEKKFVTFTGHSGQYTKATLVHYAGNDLQSASLTFYKKEPQFKYSSKDNSLYAVNLQPAYIGYTAESGEQRRSPLVVTPVIYRMALKADNLIGYAFERVTNTPMAQLLLKEAYNKVALFYHDRRKAENFQNIAQSPAKNDILASLHGIENEQYRCNTVRDLLPELSPNEIQSIHIELLQEKTLSFGC